MGKRQEKRLKNIRDKAAAQKNKPDPDEIITFRGWKMSRYTAAAIRFLEEKLGFEVSLVQGPYNQSVDASAGTHAKDGVIDLSSYRARKKVTVARNNSWAMWPREAVAGLWGAHCHGVLKRAKPMAALAVWQLETAYPNKWDGLSGNNHDNFPSHPQLERFDYNEWWHDGLLDDRIKGVTATINRLVDKLSAERERRKRLRAKKH
jgi:hypothetical protein